MRDNYERNKRFFESCDKDEVFLTFEEIKDKFYLPDWVRNDVTANRAWANTTVIQSFGACWRNYAYRAKLDKSRGGVLFLRNEAAESLQNLNTRNNAILKPMCSTTLDIDTAIANIRKYHDTTTEGEHTRYRSWAHCYRAFREYRHDVGNIDLLCLHLAWYMASWGMLRGKAYLLKMDYLVHKPLVKIVLSGKYDLLFQDEHDSNMIPLTLDFVKEIHTSYKRGSQGDTFVTKIILGIFGCAPAYDRYFKYSAKKFNVCSATFSENSLRSLWHYYDEHRQMLESLRMELTIEELHYTPMKLLDMCLFQIGLDKLGSEADEDDA